MSGLFANKGKANKTRIVTPPELTPEQPAGNESQQADFSAKAVSRAVLKSTAQNPLVLYPVTIGILGALAAALLSPMTIFIAAAAVGTALGLGTWLLDATLRREKHAGEYLRRMHQLLAQRVELSIGRLQRDLEEMGSELGLSQLLRLGEKYEAFQGLLQRKLDPNELTYSRYLGMTEQVFLAGLDNLTRVTNILQGINVINEKHIRKRLLELDAIPVRKPTHDSEYQALSDRLALKGSQTEKIETLLTQNETAMTQIDRIMAAIAEMDTSRPRATMDMESAMQELQHLAERSQAYGRNP